MFAAKRACNENPSEFCCGFGERIQIVGEVRDYNFEVRIDDILNRRRPVTLYKVVPIKYSERCRRQLQPSIMLVSCATATKAGVMSTRKNFGHKDLPSQGTQNR